MRLWSLHPCYLDARGLVALWREGLLARAVLKRETRGYRNHPQLERFKKSSSPMVAIESYLWAVWNEAQKRGYRFDQTKLAPTARCQKLPVSEGQLQYELAHLKNKLKRRDPEQFRQIKNVKQPLTHPLFRKKAGGVESWEKVGLPADKGNHFQ